MLSKKQIIVIGALLVGGSILIGVIIGFRSPKLQQNIQVNSERKYDFDDTANLPSREYMEARTKAMRRVREAGLQERLKKR